MAKSNFKKLTSIKDTEGGNFGNYEEGKGGGTPRGGVWGGKSGRVGWDERDKSGELPQGAHREEQPRTNDGKFTYNSVNGKETKYESRGETVNPLLTGGKNGVFIDDVKDKTTGQIKKEGVKAQFANKSGSLYDQYKDKWYQKGSELISKEGRKYNVRLSANDIWEIARVSFNINKGGFEYEGENFDELKKGRRSQEEKQAMQEAKTSKGETFVKNNNGAIQTKAGSQPGQKLSTGLPVSGFWRKKITPVPAAVMTQGALNQAISAPGNAAATGLTAPQTQQHVFSQNLINSLAGMAQQFMAKPVPQQAPQQKPNVKIGGLGAFKKKV